MASATGQEGKHKWPYLIILRFSTIDSDSTQALTTKHRRRLRELLNLGVHFFEIRSSYFYAPKWDFIPTGTLTIRIDEYWAQGKRKSWRDTPKQKLEHLLNDFILGAIKVADCLKKERLEREEQHRIWEEDRRLRAEAELQRRMELERRQELENQSLAWKKSQIIRNFINTVEQTASEEPDIIAKKDQLDAWLKWAHQHADRLDPLLKGFPFLSHPEEPNESY